MKKTKLIRISDDTDNMVREMGKFGEIYDQTIKRLVKKGREL